MRIALVSPYSWTYPGGVTRHIDALGRELTALGHDARVIAPFDPDDSLSRRSHRGAAPQRRELPGNLVSLGRTAGLPAKTGVGGGIVAVVPGRMAIVGFAPPLNEAGNSIRATEAINYIVQQLDMNLFGSLK